MVFEMSHSLALVREPTRIGHVWRIIQWHSVLITNHLLIYNKHIVHENDLPHPFKVIERYHKICAIKKLPYWMGHLITSHQNNTPKEMTTMYGTNKGMRDSFGSGKSIKFKDFVNDSTLCHKYFNLYMCGGRCSIT